MVELGGRAVRTSLCRFPWGVPCAAPGLLHRWSGALHYTRLYIPDTVPGLPGGGPDVVPLEEEMEGERRPGQGTKLSTMASPDILHLPVG